MVDGIPGTNGAPVPALAWAACPATTPEDAEFLKDYQCTTADVPLSYRAPRGQSVVAPYFGSYWSYISLPCATWPARDADRYTEPWNRPTANPILLVGNRQGDPATPYQNAVSNRPQACHAVKSRRAES